MVDLPGCDDELFRKLWAEKRLKYVGDASREPDAVDEASARFACATLRERHHSAVVFPDSEPRRPALLLATALLRYAIDNLGSDRPPRPVIYFGSEIGIREQLSQVLVAGGMKVSLADAFAEYHLTHGAAAPSADSVDAINSRLPRVVTAYSPIDPVGLVRSIHPGWVAIDIGDAGALPWLSPLLDHCKAAHLPSITWGRNPLSTNVTIASGRCRTLVWPFKTRTDTVGARSTLIQALQPSKRIIEPLILDGPSADTLSARLSEAGRQLAQVHAKPADKLLTDTIRLMWQWLRTLEALSVPTDLYEVEAERAWGLRSLAHLEESVTTFAGAAQKSYPAQAPRIAAAIASLISATLWVRENEPPLWTALCNLCCIDAEMPKSGRLLVFPNHSRQRLFELALLARLNISQDDLLQVGTSVGSLKVLRHGDLFKNDGSLSGAHTQVPLMVGLPAPASSFMLSCLLEHETLQFLLYAHQMPGLLRRASTWQPVLSPQMTHTIGTLASLVEEPPPIPVVGVTSSLIVRDPTAVEVTTLRRKETSSTGPLVALGTAVEEAAALFDAAGEDEADLPVLDDRDDRSGTVDSATELWCASAISIECAHGWGGLFASDDFLNVVVPGPSGLATEPRYARSIRAGDRLLLIHGSHRQSLYDLIVERVHRHPAIEVHLGLLRRWRDELRDGIRRWEPRTLDDLLVELSKKGSALTTAGTLYAWLRGWTLCPQDPADIKRTADILQMRTVSTHHATVGRAAARIRGLHRSLSRRLNRWLTEAAPGNLSHSADDVIDDELGLTFSDFSRSIVVASVVKVTEQEGPFLRSGLGQVTQEMR